MGLGQGEVRVTHISPPPCPLFSSRSLTPPLILLLLNDVTIHADGFVFCRRLCRCQLTRLPATSLIRLDMSRHRRVSSSHKKLHRHSHTLTMLLCPRQKSIVCVWPKKSNNQPNTGACIHSYSFIYISLSIYMLSSWLVGRHH